MISSLARCLYWKEGSFFAAEREEQQGERQRKGGKDAETVRERLLSLAVSP